MNELKYSSPEKEGINSADILKYIKLLEGQHISTHNMIIMRHGKIVFERYWKPFHKDYLHRMYSVSKSFVSIAVGFLEQDGLVCLDDPIVKYFPKELENQQDENMRNQTIRHMLMMSTAKPATGWMLDRPKDRVAQYFANNNKISRPSGTVFDYDSSGSFILGALVERQTGKTLIEYLREKLFDKIGVSSDAYFLTCPGGHSWGDSALICKPTDLLRTAMFCMNKGKWNSEQLLNEEYMTLATTKQIDNSINGSGAHNCQGYGYQFWMLYGNAFSMIGMGCQFAICVPEKDIIFIYNSDNQGNNDAKSMIIDNFFNIICENARDTEIPEDVQAVDALCDYTKDLKLFAVENKIKDNLRDKINNVKYILNDNPMNIKWIKFCFEGEKGKMCYENPQGAKELAFGIGYNEFTKFPQTGYPYEIGSVKCDVMFDCAVSAGWVSSNQLFLKVQVIDKCFGIDNMTFGFCDNKIGFYMQKCAEDFFADYNGFGQGIAEQ